MTTADAARERSRNLESCKTSAIVQLIALIAVFIALPILFYAVVRAWELERVTARDEMTATRISLVAAGLAPVLQQATPAGAGDLAAALARFESRDLTLTLFFRPPSTQPSRGGVYFIAGAPALSAAALKTETARLQSAGVFARVIDTCDGADPRASAAVVTGGSTRTTVTRVRGANGCWGLVSVAAVPAAAPLWSHPALRITGLVYVAMALLAVGSAVRLLTTLRRLRIGDAETPHRHDPSSLPIGPAMSAPEEPPRSDELLRSEEPPQVHGAGLLDPARGSIDLSQIIRAYLESERQILGEARGRLVDDIEDEIIIRGRADFVGTILSELIGGPLREGAAAAVTLTAAKDETRRRALLTVALQGLSSASAEMGRLPQIKQFVAALGAVSAETREGQGVTVRVAFQA